MCQWHILAHKNCSANSQFKTSAYSLQMNNLLGSAWVESGILGLGVILDFG
jgi:hypothetical protein